MGAGLLYHLAEEGCTDALLIEKGELTSGSTWHAAGQCPSLVGNYNLAKIHAYSNDLYPKLEALTGQYVSWHPSGGLRLALSPEDLDWFRYLEGIASAVGFRMQIVGVDEIKKIHPFLNTDGVLAGAWTLDDGHADPAGLCNAMARGACNMGAKVVKRNRVSDIRALASGEWEVVTEQGNIVAEVVVNAAGCYAREVAKMVGADLPICNIEHQYIVTGPIQEFFERDEEVPVVRDPNASSYIRQEQKSGLIGIYEPENLAEAWAPKGSPEWESESELFPEQLERLLPWLERAMERMPVLQEAGIKRVVNGAIPHSADGPPMLGPVAGVRNFWMCCGSSFGIAQGAGCGKYLAQWMLYGDSEINMTGFDPRRFGTYADDAFMRSRGRQDYKMTYFTPLPGEELPAARGLRTSPLHDKLKAQGCVHTETFGWERPKWFSLDGREGGIRLPAQQHFRGRARRMSHGTRAYRRARSERLCQIRRQRPRRESLSRPHLREQDTAQGGGHHADARSFRARQDRRRDDRYPAGGRSLLCPFRRRGRAAGSRPPRSEEAGQRERDD